MLCSPRVVPRPSLFSSPCRRLLPPSPSSCTTCSHAAFASISCSMSAPTAPVEPLKCKSSDEDPTEAWSSIATEEQPGGRRPSGQDGKREDGGVEEEQGISGIYVPRQKYIPIPKGELLDGILSIFESKEEADQFLRFAKCLDSILHAEHKDVLEQMRIYYTLMHTDERKALKNSRQTNKLGALVERGKSWMKKQTFPQAMNSFIEGTFSDHSEDAKAEASELPIWLAAQRAAPRYEGFLSSIGPRGRLVRKFLTWIGFIPSLPEASVELDDGGKESESYLRPNFLPRITLTDIWKPASKESCGSNVWKMFRTAASILFSRSILQV
ncbi:hypothetical protein Taro_034273 [Colocasia esculenta]|uniref:Uncharacterized protein n=1 Tax=Colocasia esculenta TaxID=4460 RepID=A0A843VQU4_COLES|nr:hypothetical protein [Colocasia esculenta]